jgi:hypothetical protein
MWIRWSDFRFFRWRYDLRLIGLLNGCWLLGWLDLRLVGVGLNAWRDGFLLKLHG